MERREGAGVLDGGLDVLVDQRRGLDGAAVHHAMADALDVGGVLNHPGLRVGQYLEDLLKRDLVVVEHELDLDLRRLVPAASLPCMHTVSPVP